VGVDGDDRSGNTETGQGAPPAIDAVAIDGPGAVEITIVEGV